MNESDFLNEHSPGRLVATVGGFQAFEPSDLPPDWEMPTEFWPMIRDAWSTVKELNGIGRVLPNPSILLKPIEDREAIQSSRIEGTFATARELLLFGKSPHATAEESDRVNQWREVWNYREALLHGTNSELPISKRLIRELHETLLLGVRGQDKNPGQFRRLQVGIRGTRENPAFVPPPWQSIEPCLDSLERYAHLADQRFDPLVNCFLVHYQFETIHPFQDGNGRVGRLLLALMIQRSCGLSHPWLFVSQYFEKHKNEYFDLLYDVSSKGDWTNWVRFCLSATISQASDTLDRCQRLLDARDELINVISPVKASNKLIPLVEMFLQLMYVTVPEVAQRFGITYPTASSYLEKLVSLGAAVQLENQSPKVYFSPTLWNVTYGDLEEI